MTAVNVDQADAQQGEPSRARPKAEHDGRPRARHLDALRGLAIALMVVDHVALLLDVQLLRLTLGRLALPIFFVLAGYLFTRITRRQAWAALLGLWLPVAVPWLSDPNVLVVFWLGCWVLWLLRDRHLVLLIVAVLTLAANGYDLQPGAGYDALALVALMAVGQMLPRHAFDFARRLPAPLALIGRYPLSFYVGHIALLEFLRRVG